MSHTESVKVEILRTVKALFYNGGVHSHKKGQIVDMPTKEAEAWQSMGIVEIQQDEDGDEIISHNVRNMNSGLGPYGPNQHADGSRIF